MNKDALFEALRKVRDMPSNHPEFDRFEVDETGIYWAYNGTTPVMAISEENYKKLLELGHANAVD